MQSDKTIFTNSFSN